MSAITPIRRAILDLVGALSYEGLERTQTALIRDQVTRMPTLEPNQFPVDRFRCTRGVPDVFVRACILDVAPERQQELWGLQFPNVDAEIRYLLDRELLNVRSCHPYGPELGGFVSPFDGSEIVSTVETDNTVPPGFQVRWRVYVNGKTFVDGTLQSGTFVSLVPQSVLCLTPAGHDLREPLAQTVTAPPEGERSAMGDGQGGDGRSSNSASEPRGWIARLSENVAAQIIATVLGFVILAIAYWKWPWIKQLLG